MQDGTKTQTDVTLGDGQTETPKFTQADLDKAVRDAKTAVMADVGRAKAESERAFKAAQDARDRLIRFEREQEEAELERNKDKPDALAAIRERTRRKQLESELEQARTELNERTTKLNELTAKETESQKSVRAQEIASRLNVDSKTLGNLAKFTDGTVEAIEEIARNLPKVTTTTATTTRPDSGRTQGGTPPTKAQIQQDYISGKINAETYAKRLQDIGEKP